MTILKTTFLTITAGIMTLGNASASENAPKGAAMLAPQTHVAGTVTAAPTAKSTRTVRVVRKPIPKTGTIIRTSKSHKRVILVDRSNSNMKVFAGNTRKSAMPVLFDH